MQNAIRRFGIGLFQTLSARLPSRNVNKSSYDVVVAKVDYDDVVATSRVRSGVAGPIVSLSLPWAGAVVCQALLIGSTKRSMVSRAVEIQAPTRQETQCAPVTHDAVVRATFCTLLLPFLALLGPLEQPFPIRGRLENIEGVFAI